MTARQSKGLDDLLHLAGSGRTSIPVNREIDARSIAPPVIGYAASAPCASTFSNGWPT